MPKRHNRSADSPPGFQERREQLRRALKNWLVHSPLEKKRLLRTLVEIGQRGSHAHGSTAAFILDDLGRHDWFAGWEMVWVVVSLRSSIPQKAMFEVLLEARNRNTRSSKFKRVLNLAQQKVKGITLEDLDEEADRRSHKLLKSRPGQIKGLHKTQAEKSKSTIRSSLTRLFSSRQKMSSTIAVGPLEPTESDIQLASLWAGDAVSTAEAHEDFSSDSAKMLSARLAEKAASEVYSRLGYTVDDIAIQQLEFRDGGPATWKSHDLEIDGQPIDVKNSRRTSKHHYARHVVKTKGNILGYKGVAIAGVASPLQFGSENALFLGQLDESVFTDIESWYTDIIDLTLSTDRAIQSHRFLPGWIYEYPSVLYESWDRDLQSFRSLSILQNHTRAAALIAEMGWNADAFTTILDLKNSRRNDWRGDFQQRIRKRAAVSPEPLSDPFVSLLRNSTIGIPTQLLAKRLSPLGLLVQGDGTSWDAGPTWIHQRPRRDPRTAPYRRSEER